jgi:hypothetical protein
MGRVVVGSVLGLFVVGLILLITLGFIPTRDYINTVIKVNCTIVKHDMNCVTKCDLSTTLQFNDTTYTYPSVINEPKSIVNDFIEAYPVGNTTCYLNRCSNGYTENPQSGCPNRLIRDYALVLIPKYTDDVYGIYTGVIAVWVIVIVSGFITFCVHLDRKDRQRYEAIDDPPRYK